MVPLPFLTPSGIAVAVATSGNRHTLSGGSRHLESNTASPGATSSITKIRRTCTASTKVALLPGVGRDGQHGEKTAGRRREVPGQLTLTRDGDQ